MILFTNLSTSNVGNKTFIDFTYRANIIVRNVSINCAFDLQKGYIPIKEMTKEHNIILNQGLSFWERRKSYLRINYRPSSLLS